MGHWEKGRGKVHLYTIALAHLPSAVLTTSDRTGVMAFCLRGSRPNQHVWTLTCAAIQPQQPHASLVCCYKGLHLSDPRK